MDLPDRNPAPPRQPVLVLGMHRSGTSALTRVANLLGADVPTNLWPANDGNERGYWESQDLTAVQQELMNTVGSEWDQVVRVPDAAFAGDVAAACRERAVGVLRRDFADSSLFVLKDPRMSLLVPFWTATLAQFTAAEPVFLIAVRNPLEVAASLAKRNQFRPQKSMLLWLRHTLEAERATRGLRRCILSYDALMSDWRATVARVARLTGIAWPRSLDEVGAAIDAELSDDLRHARASAADVAADPSVPPWVRAVYPALVAAADDPDGAVPTETFDRVLAALDEADAAYGPLMAEHHQATWMSWNLQAAAGATEAARAAAAGRVAELEGELRTRAVERRLAAEDATARLAAVREEADRGRARERATASECDRLRFQADVLRRGAEKVQRPPVPTIPAPAAVPVAPPPQIVAVPPAPPTAARRTLFGLRPSPAARLVPESAETPKLQAVRQVRASGLFDDDFYRRQAGDLGSTDAARHYLDVGAAAGLDPHPLFRTRFYEATYPDVTATATNPLVHFATVGQAEGRSSHPLFDVKHYGAQPGAGAPPLSHYLGDGWRAGLEPNWLFDGRFYAAANADVAGERGFNPLAHFVAVGWREGRDPHPLFDVDFYLAANADVAAAGSNPLEHFLAKGVGERRPPNRFFDFDYYAGHNPDVGAVGLEPLAHFVRFGWREGRNPGPAFDMAAYRLFGMPSTAADVDPLAHYLATGNARGIQPFGADRLAAPQDATKPRAGTR